MVTTLLVHIWYDGAVTAGTPPPTPDSYASSAPPIGAFSIIDGYGGSPFVGVPGTYNTSAPPIGALAFFRGYGRSGIVVPPPVAVETAPGGVKRRVRVRRSDFSSQENYELALKAALAGAGMAFAPAPVEKPPEKKATDTVIKVSAEAMQALQGASDMDELELIQIFIKAIESEYE